MHFYVTDIFFQQIIHGILKVINLSSKIKKTKASATSEEHSTQTRYLWLSASTATVNITSCAVHNNNQVSNVL